MLHEVWCCTESHLAFWLASNATEEGTFSMPQLHLCQRKKGLEGGGCACNSRRRVFKGLWSQTGHRQSGLCASCHLLKVKAFSLLLKVAKIILGYWDLKEKLVDMTTPHLNLKKPLQTSKKQPLVKRQFSKVVWMSHLTNSKVVQITFWLFDNGTSPALRQHWRWQSVM